MSQKIDPLPFKKMFQTPSNIAIIGYGRFEVFEEIKSFYDLSLFRVKREDRQGVSDAIQIGTKGIFTTLPGSSPTQLRFLLAIWLRERGDNSNENILLEKAKKAFDWIIVTDKSPKDQQSRITKICEAPFTLQH